MRILFVNDDRRICQIYNQCIATLGVLMLITQVGIIAFWPSPNIAFLTKPNSPIPLTKDEASWLASISYLGSVVGSVLGATVNMYIGNRRTILIAFFFINLSWISLIVSNSVIWLYVVRLLSGIGKGSAYSCFSLYLGEISSPDVRGTLISIAVMGNIIGALFGIIAETYLPKKVSSSIYLVHGLIGALLFTWLMDSPYYFVKVRKLDLAKKAIAFYDKHSDTHKRLIEVRNYIMVSANNGVKDKLREFFAPAARRSIGLIILLFALPQLSGFPTFGSYMEIIMTNSKSTLIEPRIFVIIASAGTIVVVLCTYKLIDKLGRRMLLVISSAGTAVGMIGLGLHFLLLNLAIEIKYISWLPLVSVLISSSFYVVGMMSVPNTILSEIFSDNTKSIAACIAALTSSLAAFAGIKLYQPIVDSFGEVCAFWMYALCCLLIVPCVMFLMIETKGKTIQEIQNDLVKKESDPV